MLFYLNVEQAKALVADAGKVRIGGGFVAVLPLSPKSLSKHIRPDLVRDPPNFGPDTVNAD
jgi:hypothetical protein